MTDNEAICTAIVGGFTVLGAAVRWSASIVKGVAARVVKAIDDSTAAWKETSTVVGLLTQKLVTLEAKIDVQRAVEQAVEEAVDEVSGVHAAASNEFELAPPGVARRTPPGGYSVQKRPRTQGGR